MFEDLERILFQNYFIEVIGDSNVIGEFRKVTTHRPEKF